MAGTKTAALKPAGCSYAVKGLLYLEILCACPTQDSAASSIVQCISFKRDQLSALISTLWHQGNAERAWYSSPYCSMRSLWRSIQSWPTTDSASLLSTALTM